MKMANIDAVCDHIISRSDLPRHGLTDKNVRFLSNFELSTFEYMQLLPVPTVDEVCSSKNAEPLENSRNLYYFADICAGPGGFSEYLLCRRSFSAKGFGLTLKGLLDE